MPAVQSEHIVQPFDNVDDFDSREPRLLRVGRHCLARKWLLQLHFQVLRELRQILGVFRGRRCDCRRVMGLVNPAYWLHLAFPSRSKVFFFSSGRSSWTAPASVVSSTLFRIASAALVPIAFSSSSQVAS